MFAFGMIFPHCNYNLNLPILFIRKCQLVICIQSKNIYLNLSPDYTPDRKTFLWNYVTKSCVKIAICNYVDIFWDVKILIFHKIFVTVCKINCQILFRQNNNDMAKITLTCMFAKLNLKKKLFNNWEKNFSYLCDV